MSNNFRAVVLEAETLESRALASATLATPVAGPVQVQVAIVSAPVVAHDLHAAMTPAHNYHLVTGFFGE
jgi:hypothetical protein